MKFHIVGNGENVDDILKGYDITLDELKNENKHIRMWNYLIPGTKLKIPVLTESIIEDINEIEPFIEDYYPKIKVEEEYQIIADEEGNVEEDNFGLDASLVEEKQEDVLFEETNENNIVNEVKEENIEKILATTKEENIVRPNNSPIMYRYMYQQPYYYYRPIIYVIPRNKI